MPELQPELRFFRSLTPNGFHRVAYWEWGARDAPRTVVCVHGLARNGRDFDAVARALVADGARVVCPDVAGRGKSEWLDDAALYAIPTYCADLSALIARLDVDSVDWVGTSMGGLIGMALAAQPGTPIRRLVLNDIGPFVPKEALARLASYVGAGPRDFATLEELEALIRRISAPFGPLTDAQWRYLTETTARKRDDGRWEITYDAKIGEAFRSTGDVDIALWFFWDAIHAPVLSLRGATSDVFPRAVQDEMQRRTPTMQRVEFPECGHAPALLVPHQIEPIRQFLNTPL
ncbi:MAG: putative carboxylesterase [Rhodospirillales bacterium]|nr:putative carboxylesterase [Rhodospirillales bacterium]